jgi:hypothetical protein
MAKEKTTNTRGATLGRTPSFEGLTGQATPDQIAAWKKLHGDVYEITVNNHVGYVRGFDRATMKFALSQLKIKLDKDSQGAEVSVEKMIELGEIGLKNCWIGGSDEILSNDRMFMAAALQVGELFEIAETTLKKL